MKWEKVNKGSAFNRPSEDQLRVVKMWRYTFFLKPILCLKEDVLKGFSYFIINCRKNLDRKRTNNQAEGFWEIKTYLVRALIDYFIIYFQKL